MTFVWFDGGETLLVEQIRDFVSKMELFVFVAEKTYEGEVC